MRKSIVRRTLSLFLLGLVACGAVALSAEPKFVTAPVNPIPDQYIVVFQEGAVRSPEAPSAPTVEKLAREMAGVSKGTVLDLWRFSRVKGFVARMSSQAARTLSNDPRVKFVEQSAWMSAPISAPIKDCRFQTGIYNESVTRPTVTSPQSLNCSDPDPQHSNGVCVDNWGLDRIDSPLAIQDQDPSHKDKYLFSATGAGVHIYILDTGAYTGHSELDGRLGLKVDVTRRDVNGEIIYGPAADVEDEKLNSHGTHVTAIAGGRTIGVAKGAILHPVRIYRGAQDPLQNLVLALMWIADHHGSVLLGLQGPAVASLSSNSDTWRNSASLRLAVKALNEAGILLVESAGNKKEDACRWTLSDAQLSENLPVEARMKIQGMVLVAGGMDEKDGRWLRIPGDPTYSPEDYDGDGTIEFNEPGLCVDGLGQPIPDGDCGSNWGSCIDLWAPAAHIVSACHHRASNQYADPDPGPNVGEVQPANGFCRLSGTSMAAPHVAGVAALFLQNHPNATPAQVVTALRAVAARDKLCTDGRIGCNSIRGEGETTPTPGAPNLVLQSQFPTSGPPVAGDDSFDVNGGFLDIAYAGLLANDVDWSNFTLSVVALGAAGHGNVGSCCSGATFSYQPDPGYSGPDQFTYTISNGHGVTATGTVHLQVTGTGPVPMLDELSTVRDTSFTFLASELLANDSAGAIFLNASAIPGTTLGIVQLEGVGPQDVQYRYFPPAGFTGSDQFRYTIQDSAGRQAIGSVVVTIGDPPVAAPDTLTTVTNVRVRFYASELLLNDTPGVEFINAGQPQLGSLTIAGIGPEDIVYDYYPPAGFIGTDTFPYTIQNSNGFQATGTVTVNIQDAVPVASFTSNCTGRTCSFNASGSQDDVQIASYNWAFGDGQSGSGNVVTHTFSTNNSFTISLQVEDTAQQVANATATVAVSDASPAACFTAVRNGLTYTFDASCSTDDFGISTYSWNFGDGTTGAGKIVSHTYAVSGPRTAVLTVTDTGSQTATTSQSVNPDAKPVANFTFTCSGRTCTFDASSSTDNAGIVSYAWSFGDGTTGSGVTVTHTYATSGSFSVTLTVTDTVGQTASTTKTVPIDLNPTACFTAVRDGLVYTFDASCSTDDLGISTYSWNFGDGTTGSGKNVSHTYATSGPRTVVLTVTDTGSHTATSSQSVNPDAKPVANFTWSCTQRTCSFNGTSSTDNQPIPTFSWNFGDGTTGSGATPTHVYAAGGSKTVILTVTDSVGQTNSKTQTVAVNRPPIAVNDSATTNQNVAIDINVVVNDSDPDGDSISVSTWTQPAHGSASKNANGTMRYTPAAGYTGGDSFTYQITDGKEPSGSATVSLTVVVPNKPPDAWDDGWYTYQNGPTNIPYSHLLANDYDPNGDALTVTGINTTGLSGTLDCSFGTYCRFTPPSWFVGTTSFTYSANDGKGGTDLATVRIKVGIANGVPAPQDDILETAYNTALTFTRAALLLNDSDPNGDVLSVTAVYRAPLTALGTISCSAANYVCTYTPPAGFTGVDVLTYQASDGVDMATARIRILVRQPSPTVLDAREDQTFFTSYGGTFLNYTWMTSNDYDPEGGALTVVSVDTTGLLGTLDCTTYSSGCEYTRGTSDVTRFRYTVRDPQGNLATTTVTLKPGNWSFNLNPVLANDQLSTRMNTPLTFSIFDVLRNDYDPDNDQLAVSFYFASPHGQVICSTPAYLCTYTPSANYTGTDTLTYFAQDGNNSLSASVTVNVLPQVAKDALVLSQSVPVSMFAGQSYPVSVRLKNVGTSSWSLVGAQCSAFRLGSVNPYDNTTWGASRAELPSTVAPGGEVTVSFNVTAPATPGTYNFQRRMVHECVEWFGDLTPNVVVAVSP